jgi:hypothetical protein
MSDAVRIASRQSFALLWSSKIHKPATGLAVFRDFSPQPLLEARLALALRELGPFHFCGNPALAQ